MHKASLERIYFIFFLCCSSVLFSQITKKDSTTYQQLMSKSWELRNNYTEAAKYTDKAKKIAIKNNDSTWIAQTFYYKAIFKYYQGEYRETLSKCDSAAIWYPTSNPYGVASIYNLKGLVATDTDNFIDAITYYQSSLDYAKKTTNLYAISNPNHNIGILYQKLNQNKEALKYFHQALRVREKIKDSIFIYQSYLSIGGAYNLLKKHDSAIVYLSKVIDQKQPISDIRTLAYAHNNIGLVYKEGQKFDAAIKNYEIADSLHTDLKDNLGLAEVNNNLSKVYQQKKRYKVANRKARKALEFAKNIQSQQEIVNSLELIAQNFEFLKKKDSALAYYNRFIIQKDSLIDESRAKRIAELQIKYDFTEKENELLKTQTEKATTELNLSKQKELTYGLIGGLAIVLLIGFSIFQRNKRKHQLAIAKEKEQGFQSIIKAEEKERGRIARELHDGIVQQIGSIILSSRNIFKKQNLNNDKESQELLLNLENSSEELRSISHQMMPRALEESGLIDALQSLFDYSLNKANITSTFESFNIDKRLENNIEITLYRISQELVQNIIKHSKASEVHIELYKSGNHIMYLVQDNGIGIQYKKTIGIGLENIKSRIDLVHGSVIFANENGTLVTIKIPV
jgi:signal transduction histidine kinase